MDQPHTTIWGPALWNILHYSAERIGNIVHNRMPQEETRLWTGLLSSLQYSIPCPLCKKHYTAYINSNKIDTISKTNIRIWLFDLHTYVNSRIGKTQTIAIENVPIIYGTPFNYTAYFNIINDQMLKALRLSWIVRNDYQRTIRFLEEIRRYYDFF
jgi:hypothetical protein